jgi:hypothetical protein
VRRLCVLIRELPLEGRLKRRLAGDDGHLDQKEHLLVGIYNWMAQAAYWSRAEALKGLKDSEARELSRNAPKPLERPGKTKQHRFLSAPELVRALGGSVRVVKQ